MPFTLPELPYAQDAFENGFCSTETFEYHYQAHHAAYVKKLNAAVEDTDYAKLSLEEVIQKSYQEQNMAVFHNAAQHFNHSFFWNCFSPQGGGQPDGKIADLISRDFGSYETFQEEFSQAAATLFGSGWAWLTMNTEGKLKIEKYKDADTPVVSAGKTPLLTLDVWEHAYYIDYRNKRPDFIAAFWDVVNWDHGNTILA